MSSEVLRFLKVTISDDTGQHVLKLDESLVLSFRFVFD